jgi:hypothetical protein
MKEILKNLGKCLRKKKLEVNKTPKRVQILSHSMEEPRIRDIGERQWRRNIRRRMMIFESMIESTLM